MMMGSRISNEIFLITLRNFYSRFNNLHGIIIIHLCLENTSVKFLNILIILTNLLNIELMTELQ